MSEFNVSMGGNPKQRVVQRESGADITLKSTPVTSVTRLTDVDLSTLADGAVLVYDAATESFKTQQFLQVDESGKIKFEGGGDF